MIGLVESFAAPGKWLLLRRLAPVRVWPSRENFSLLAVATSAKVQPCA
jgi:hypothetical protein